MIFKEWIETPDSDIARDMLELNSGLQVMMVSIQDAMEYIWNAARKHPYSDGPCGYCTATINVRGYDFCPKCGKPLKEKP